MIIKNAASLGLAAVTQMPNMSTTLDNWAIPLTFGRVTKEQVGFYTREKVVNVTFEGVWQPLTAAELKIMPEGERGWEWYWIHSKTNLELKRDDTIRYKGKQYRVMRNKPYKLNGIFEYMVIEDFEGVGPEESE